MNTPVTDQADGLRRLMAGKTARRVAVIDSARGADVCSVSLNLAAALALQGHNVLRVDEHSGTPSMPLQRDGRLVLVDAALDADGALSPEAADADHIIVVFQANAQAITQAYLRIKKLHYAHAFAQLRVLVNEVDDETQAKKILDNLASTGSRYLGLTLQSAGFVRADPLLTQARRLNLTVVQAFKASAAAQDFGQIASDLMRWPYSPAEGHMPLTMGQAARSDMLSAVDRH